MRLANLSPWKEEMPLSALDLHLPAHTSCTGFSSAGTQLDGYDASQHGSWEEIGLPLTGRHGLFKPPLPEAFTPLWTVSSYEKSL